MNRKLMLSDIDEMYMKDKILLFFLKYNGFDNFNNFLTLSVLLWIFQIYIIIFLIYVFLKNNKNICLNY